MVKDLDNDWVVSLKEGSRDAFGEIYAHYWKSLLSVAYGHTKDKEMAEEIVQDVFVSLWQRRDQVDIQSLSAYLATAVKFATFKTLQRSRRQEQIREDVLPQHGQQLDEEAIDARFLKEYLDGVIENLPDRCRLVFQLSRDAQKSHQEIAEQLSISEKAVEANITRALKVLRVNLRRVGFGLFFFFFF